MIHYHYLVVSLLAICVAQGCRREVDFTPWEVTDSKSPSEKSKEPPGSEQDAREAVAAGDWPSQIQPIPTEQATESHQRMLAALADVVRRTPKENKYLGDHSQWELRRQLEEHGQQAGAAAPWNLRLQVALGEFRLGHEQAAIDLFEDVYKSFAASPAASNPANASKLALQLGVTYLRLAETQNCCQRYTTDSCVFPIQGQGIHQRPQASRQAVRYFQETLKSSPPDSRVHLSARWLLNVAYMTLGEYPHGVPSEYLIPPGSFQSRVEFPRFKNVAPEVGLATDSLSGGVVCDDLDNDGYLDLLVSTWEPAGQIRLFHNNAQGHFIERTEQSGLRGIVGGLNLVQADYDNDGLVDVLVLRGAWLGRGGAHPNSLLRNLGGGRFVDVTFAAGLAQPSFPTQTAAWADYNNDGYVDLYIGNETTDGVAAPCQLFRNNKDGTFTDVAAVAGVTNDRFTKAVAWGDVDQDGLPELYISNLRQPNRLYLNHGDGTFTDVALQRGVSGPNASFPTWFWDFDNDGDLDLFVSAYAADIAEIAAAYLGLPQRVELACLYRNDGSGHFVDVARQLNLVRPNAPMGSNFGDLDNDGFLDFYLGTGYPDYRSLMPNEMYWNRGAERFENVTVAGGFGNLQKGHAVVFADLDNDGDQDVFEQMGGALAGDSFVDCLYRNPGFGHRWLAVQLLGRRSNRSAIGARIRVVVETDGQERAVVRYVNSGGSFGANPLRQHFGLGQADRIKLLEVYWPTSKTTQTFRGVRPDNAVRITEGVDQLQSIPLKMLQLGSP